jgi:hypothetical protein
VRSENSPDAVFTLQSGQTQPVTLGPGSFLVGEVVPEGFENPPQFTGDGGGTISI